MAEARNRAHGEALATKIRAENQQFQMDQQARQEQAVNQRMQMSDYLGGKRDERNFSQQKELQGLSQTFSKQQAEAGRAASLADNDRKRAEDAAQAEALAQAGGLPVEASMPDGVQGPGQMIDYGKVGTQGVGQLIGNQRMQERDAASQANVKADNERQDVALEGTAEYRNQMLELRRKQMEAAAQNKKPVQSPDQKVTSDKAQRFLSGYISQLQKSMSDPKEKKVLDKQGLTQEALRARIEILSETIRRNMQAAPTQTPAAPAKSQSYEDKLREVAGG